MTEPNDKKTGTVSAEKIDQALAESFGEEANWDDIFLLGLSPRDSITDETESDRQLKLNKAIGLLESSESDK